MEDLPTSVDVVVLGTGLTESIVAAACSRIGKSVLHFDHRCHYGAHFTAFNFNDLQKAFNDPENTDGGGCGSATSSSFSASVPEGQRFVPVKRRPLFSNVHMEFRAPDNCEWTEERIQKDSRKFNLDLAPRLLFARGKMVELLISSNIAKYAEFKLVSRVLTLKDGNLEQVPCSRADVFATKSVNVVEKRALMKLMTAIQDFEKQEMFTEWLDRPFDEFLARPELHLTDNLRHFIVNSIAMYDECAPTRVALANAKKFLQSLGRYGNSPFLCPIYGCGELPQCFCRLCAVFGGVYHLERRTDGFLVDGTNRLTGVVSQGKTFTATHVITNLDVSPEPSIVPDSFVSRAIVIATESMLPLPEKEQVTLLRVPSEQTRPAVTVIEQGPSMMVCPKGLVVAHLSCRNSGHSSAKEDLSSLVDQLYRREHQLWVAFFNTLDTANDKVVPSGDIRNLFTMATPGFHLDYDFHIDQAKNVFHEMFPNEEFLPRAPDPEEIILDFEESSTPAASGENTMMEPARKTEEGDSQQDATSVGTKTEEDSDRNYSTETGDDHH